MELLAMVKEQWHIFGAIGLIMTVFVIISESRRRSDKKEAIKRQSEVGKQE
jgi:hypothetical protein